VLAKFGAIVTEGRGKLGEVVFTRGHYGASAHAYAPPYSVSHGTPSAKQVAMWNQFQYVRTLWPTISDDAREAWRQAAAVYPRENIFGDKMPLTGQAFFVKLNVRLLLMQASWIQLPPALIEVQHVQSLDSFAIYDNGNCSLQFTGRLNYNDFYCFAWLTPSLSQGVNNPRCFPRLISVAPFYDPSVINLDGLFHAYFEVYPEVNKKIFAHIQSCHFATGLVSPRLQITTIVQAS
jgi:hypothetical protein